MSEYGIMRPSESTLIICTVYLIVSLSLSSLDVAKEFQEEAYSVAIHPSGLFLLVGFSEKLRLMNVLIDDIRPFKEIMIRGCREVRMGMTCKSSLLFLSLSPSVPSVMVVTCLQQLMQTSFKSTAHSRLITPLILKDTVGR